MKVLVTAQLANVLLGSVVTTVRWTFHSVTTPVAEMEVHVKKVLEVRLHVYVPRLSLEPIVTNL